VGERENGETVEVVVWRTWVVERELAVLVLVLLLLLVLWNQWMWMLKTKDG
jgi:hypothetical protein